VSRPLFQLGKLVLTSHALKQLDPQSVYDAFKRYIQADWGDLCSEDKQVNNDALLYGNRILAAYSDSKGIKFWIITEGDRSYTTVLLPEEY
jgi:hypothetical protein